MSAMTCYADNFSASFVEEQELIKFVKEREALAMWKTLSTNKVKFHAIEEGTPEADKLLASYRASGIELVITDTFRNTGLFVDTGFDLYPVRGCALKTIQDRARITGHALSKVRKTELAKILNYCVAVAKGDSLLRVADGKISAMHGGDENEYSILPTPELFRLVTEYLSQEFPGYRFICGDFDHTMTTAVWSLENTPELLDTYKAALAAHNIIVGKMTPALRFTTSDVGQSGANLYPMLMSGGGAHTIALGSALKLEHKHGATLKKFEQQLQGLFAAYKEAVGRLANLADIEIRYPCQAMLRVMKRIAIGKKLAYQTLELFKAQHGEMPCTVHDVYLGICEAIFQLECDGANGSKIAKMEENVARALTVRWSDYDYPGELDW